MGKIWIVFAGIFATIAIILGFRIEDQKKDVEAMRELLSKPESSAGNAQEIISRNREKILSRAAKSPIEEITQEVTTETIIPGKVVAQPVTTATKSTKTTKSS